MRVGTEEDARLIYRRRKSGLGPLPKGWRKLGAGSYRTTYLSPDGIVYKLCCDDYPDANIHEFYNYDRIKRQKVRLPKGWKIAPTARYVIDDGESEITIIAMKYIEGNHIMVSDREADEWFHKIGASKAFGRCGLWDLHEENFVITPKGEKVIIDLGA